MLSGSPATAQATTITSAPTSTAVSGQFGVAWTTDLAATTEVAWDTVPRSSWGAYTNTSSYSSTSSTRHAKTVQVAQRGITWFYRVRSTGTDSQTVTSSEYSVYVPAASATTPIGDWVFSKGTGFYANGSVLDTVLAGSTLFTVGSFDEVAHSAQGLGSFTTSTAAISSSFPEINTGGWVNTIEPDGTGGFVIGGLFSSVDGFSVSNLAHILPDGGVDIGWTPNPNGEVRTVALSGSTVYAGGDFTTISGATRNRLAALDLVTGALASWNPNINNSVFDVTTYGTTVYAVGAFTLVNGGTTRNRAAAFDATTATATSWNPNLTGTAMTIIIANGTNAVIGGSFTGYLTSANLSTGTTSGSYGLNGTVRDLALNPSANWVYVAGDFTCIGSCSSIGGALRLNAATLARDGSWAPSAGWDANAYTWLNWRNASIAATDTEVYIGGIPGTFNGSSRQGVVRVDATTGTTTSSWDPQLRTSNGYAPAVFDLAISGSSVVAGGFFAAANPTSRLGAAAFNVSTGALTSWDPNLGSAGGSAIATDGTNLYVSGSFSAINGATSRNGLAAVDSITGTATSWNPNPNSSVSFIEVSGGTVYIAGSFTQIGSTARSYLAAVPTGSATPTSWNPSPTAQPDSMILDGSTIWVSGSFTTIGGQSRAGLAGVSLTTGAATSWTPPALQVPSWSNSRRFIGLNSNNVIFNETWDDGCCDSGINTYAASKATGALQSFPNLLGSASSILQHNTTTKIFGGSLQNLGGTRSNAASLNSSNTLTSWNSTGTDAAYPPSTVPQVSGDRIWYSTTANHGTSVATVLAATDSSAPTISASSTSHTAGSLTWSTDATVDMSVSCSSSHPEGVSGWSYQWSASASGVTPDAALEVSGNPSSMLNLAPGDGIWYFHARCVDAAGTWSSVVTAGPYRIDTTPPTNAPAANVYDMNQLWGNDVDWSNATLALSASWDAATDTGSGVASYSACFTAANLSGTSGSCSGAGVAPVVSSNTSRFATVTASPALVHGQTVNVCVQATDNAGLTASWTCSDGFRIDLNAPTPPTVSEIFDLSTTWSADMSWSGSTTALSASWFTGSDALSGIASYNVCFSTSGTTCANIAGTTTQSGNTSRQATATATGMTHGTQYFTCIQAIDNAGNISSWSCSNGFTIDTAAPSTLATTSIFDMSTSYLDATWSRSSTSLAASWYAGADALSGVASYNVCFSTSGATCANISGTATQTGNTSRTATATATGMTSGSTYYTCIQVVDNAGNPSSWACSNGFTVDTTPPTNPVQAQIWDLSAIADQDWVIGGASSLQSVWSGGSDAASGIASFDVCFSTSAASCINIAGTTTIAGNTAGFAVVNPSPTLNSGTSYTCVRANDAAGNAAVSWACSDGFTVDATAPTNPASIADLSVTLVDAMWTSSSTALSASWTAGADTGGSGVRDYSVCFTQTSITGTSGSCTAVAGTSTITGNTSRTVTATATGLTNGSTYYTCVRTYDTVGNASTWICSNGFTVDTTLPTNPLATEIYDLNGLADKDWWNSTTSLLALVTSLGSDAGSGVGILSVCFSTSNTTCSLIPGASLQFGQLISTTTSIAMTSGTTYYTCVQATDQAGNVAASWACSDGFTIDTAAPTNPTSANIFDLSTALVDADWTTSTTALSASWNPGTDSLSGITKYDLCFSTVNSGCTNIAGTTTQSVLVASARTATATATGMADGTYFTCVRTYDLAGNVAASWSCSDGFTIDTTAPTGGSVSYTNGWIKTTSASITLANGTDAASGLGTRTLQRQSATYTAGGCGAYGAWTTTNTNPSSPVANTVASGNCYKYQYIVADAVGNTTTYASASVLKVDTVAPSSGTFFGATGWRTTASASVVFGTSSDALSGVASWIIERQQATLSGGVCGAYGAWTQIGGASPASPLVDTTVVSGACYSYRKTTTDNAGNTAQITQSQPVKIDTEFPSGGSISYTDGWTTGAGASASYQLDSAFGTAGVAAPAPIAPVGTFTPTNPVTQPDGKIIVAGTCESSYFCVSRYTSSGVLDTSFDGDGMQTTPITSFTASLLKVLLQPDGKIILVGICDDGSGIVSDICLVRYTTSGALDTSFDGDGIVIAPASASIVGTAPYVQPVDAHLQSSGAIMVAAMCGDLGQSKYYGCAARFTTAGALDTSFDSDGYSPLASMNSSTNDVSLWGSLLQPDGKLILVGTCAYTGSGYDFCLARFNADGTLDTSFDSDGMASTPIAPSAQTDWVFSWALQSDGKIVVAGQCGTSDDMCLARWTAAGALDTTFDTDGKVVSDVGGTDGAFSVKVLPDGKLLVAGTCASNTCIARYTSAGTLDTSYGTAGVTAVAAGAGSGDIRYVASDGTALVAGTCDVLVTPSLCVMRFTPSGALDTTLDGDGVQMTGAGDSRFEVQSASTIVAVSTCDTAGGTDWCAAKYGLTTGVLSPTISLVDGVDLVSGLGKRMVEVQTAPLSSGTCGTFGSWSTSGGYPTASYTSTLTSGTCYRFRYSTEDTAIGSLADGNTTTYTTTSVMKVDAELPASPASATIADVSTAGIDADWSSSATALSTSWGAGSDGVSGVASYNVCFSTINTGCSAIGGTSMLTGLTGFSATATATGMSSGITYYSCVQVVDVAGNTGSWSCSDGFVVDTTAPTPPTSSDIFDLSTSFVDQSLSTSPTALSASWNAGTDTTSGIATYDVCFSNVNTDCTNIAGTTTQHIQVTSARSATATATGMVDGTYFTCIRTHDNAGNVSSWTCSNGFLVDTTAPTNPSSANIADLSDVLIDVDDTAATTALSASWSTAFDAGSGIATYTMCFTDTLLTGTAASCSPIPGTSVVTGNTSRTVTATASPAMTSGLAYYTCIRAVDVAGNAALTWTCSDGFTVDGTPPTNPARANIYDLNTAAPDRDWTLSATALSASWSAGGDSGSGVRDYDVCFSSVSSGCITIPGTNIETGNTSRTATATASGLAEGATYFTCIRTWDIVGNDAGWQCSDGFSLDTTPPSSPDSASIADLPDSGADRDWSNSTTSLSASWNAGTDATSGVRDYDVCFSTVNDGCSAIPGTAMQTGNTARTATASATGMTAGLTYYTCVRTWDTAGLNSGWACSDGFVIDTTAPTAPAQADISDMSTTSVDADWTNSATDLSASWGVGADDASGVRDYDVCFSLVNTGCSTIAGTTTQIGTASRTATATATAMVSGLTYYTCVRVHDTAGNTSGWQCSDGFMVDAVDPVNPTHSNIFDLSTSLIDTDWTTSTTSLSASWNAGSDSASGIRDYDVCFSTVDTGCTEISGTTTETGNTSRSATATATGMTSGTTYYTCVRTWDIAGNTAGWQCSDGFTIDTGVPSTPAQSGIFDLSITQFADLDWNTSATTLSASWLAGADASSGVRDYDVCFSAVSNGCSAIDGAAMQTGNTTQTATATATGMTNGIMYYVCVRAWDNAGNISDWQCSDGFTVDTIAPDNPTQAQIYDLSTSGADDMDWNPSTSALSASWSAGSDAGSGVRDYDVCFSTVDTGCSLAADTTIQTGISSSTASTTANTLVDGTAYFTCVRTWDVAGNNAGWVCSDGFGVDAVDPSNPSTENIFDLTVSGSADRDWTSSATNLSASWNAATDATSGIRDYDVCFSTQNAGCTNIPGTATATGNTLRTVTATATGLAPNTTYYTCVRSWDNAGRTPGWQCSDGFALDADNPANPTSANIYDMSTSFSDDRDWANTTTALSASWGIGSDGVSGIRDYDVCFSTDNTDCTHIPGTTTQTGNTSRTVTDTATGMTPGTMYYTCVRVNDNSGNTPGWTCSDGFQIDQDAPSNPPRAEIFDLTLAAAHDVDWSNSTSVLSASWNAGSDTGGSDIRDYDVCFSSASAACDPIPGTTMQTGNTSRTATATATGMSMLTPYYTCVRAWDNAGSSASWECSDGFQVDQTASTPPSSGSVFDLSIGVSDSDWSNSTTALNATWGVGADAGSGIRDYDVCFSTIDTSCVNIAGTFTQTGNTTRSASATASGMTQGITYYTCVRAWDEAGNGSAWSCSDGFTIDTAVPANPSAASIFDLNTGFTSDLDWNTSSTALSASWSPGIDLLSGIRDYDVCFSSDSGTCTPIAGTTLQTANTARTATDTATGMSDAVQYYTCVRAWDLAGNTPGWTCSDGFVVDATAPDNPTPVNIFDLDATWTSDADYTTDTTTLAASWNLGADATSGVRDYDACFTQTDMSGTAGTCTPVAGSSVQSGNTTRTIAATATGLSSGTTYYTCVRTWDVAGTASVWGCSDGFTPDTAAPINPTQSHIYDLSIAFGPDLDSTTSVTWVSGSWDAGSDTISGVRDYDVCFSASDTNCVPIDGTAVQSSNTIRNATATPTGMVPGTTYFTCVRTHDVAGNMSGWQCSDGFVSGASSVTVSVDTSNISFGTIVPGLDYFASSTVTVTSNSATGYTLSVNDGSDSDGMTCACSDVIPDWTGSDVTPAVWSAGSSGFFGMTVRDAGLGRLVKWGSGIVPAENDVLSTKYVGLKNSASTVVHQTPTLTSGSDSILATYRVNAGNVRPGSYSTTVTYTVTANP